MSAKQIHELPAVEAVDPADQLVISTTEGRLTRRVPVGMVGDIGVQRIGSLASVEGLDPDDKLVVSTAAGQQLRHAATGLLSYRPFPGGQPRRVADKLAERVSIRDFGAKSDGSADCAPALAQAITLGHKIVHFPPGTYRFDSKVTLPAGTTLEGAGPHAVEIDARGDYWVELLRNSAPGYTQDWCRCQISGFTVAMAQGGILGHGHEIRISNMRFRQGAAGAWCIELHASNECVVAEISGGYGGGETGFDLHANGVRIYATNELGESTVNYGDGLLQEISLKGDRPGWTGIKLEHLSENSSLGSINNMLLSRIQCQAPLADSSSPDYVQAGSVGAYAGSVGIALHRVQRSTFITVDVEGNATGFAVSGAEHGTTGVAVNLGSTATRRNVFMGCQAFNTASPWSDTNATLDGSVGQNTFIAGQEHGPLQPTGFANGDPVGANNVQTFAGRRSTYDMLVPGGIWLARPNNGQFKGGIRMTDAEAVYFFADYQEPSRDGTTLYPYDGMPKYATPRKALGVDVSSSPNEARLFRPQGYVAQGSVSGTSTGAIDATLAPAKESRITIGNGPGFTIGGVAINALHRVQIQDPLYLREFVTGEPLPTNFYTGQPSTIVNVQDNVMNTNRWAGPGLYAAVRDNATTGRRWVPIGPKLGIRPAQTGRTGSAYTIGRDDLDAIKTYTGGTGVGCTLTLPNNLLFDKELATVAGYSTATSFDIVRTDNDPLIIDAAATGITMLVDGSTSDQNTVEVPVYSSVVRVHYIQTGAATATVYLQGIRAPHVGQSQALTPGALLAVTPDHMAKGTLVLNPSAATISLQLGTGLVPTGFGTAKLVVVNKNATNNVDIAAGVGMTLNAPADGVRLKQNRPVTVHLVGNDIFIDGATTASS